MKNLTCTVLQSKHRSQSAWTFTSIATVRSPDALVLIFDLNACYNIQCETSDTPNLKKRLVWSGSFNEKNGYKISSKSPYYLSGGIDGAGCTSLAPWVDELNITIQLIKAPPRGATDLRPYICAEVAITGACFQCPSGMVPRTDCPNGVWDCHCPAPEVRFGNDKCKPCEAGFHYNKGACIFDCPGDLVPFRKIDFGGKYYG